MLRTLKLTALNASRAFGLFRVVRNSSARAKQLLILCYHGISIDDEHEWAPGLYMSQDQFAQRIALLRRGGYTVLPLEDAVRRLYSGTLPPRSVAITFDDGNFDFYSRAWPVLNDAGMPATVYLTTYYCDRNLPIFPLAISYLLWKGRGRVASLALSPELDAEIDTRTPEARRRTHGTLVLHAQDTRLSATEKDRLASALADVLELDYADIARRRLLHIMNPAEVRELAAAGVDFQLHTHRHRSPLDRAEYVTEIDDNRRRIATYAGRTPSHFCYPSGVAMPEFARWLDEEGVMSATTCEPGMATAGSKRLQLPRLLDHSEMTELEFEAWLSGIGALLPHRPIGFQPVDREGRLIIRQTADAGAPTLVPDGGESRAVRV